MQYEIKRAIEPYISLVVLSGTMDENDQKPFFQAIKGLLEEDHSVVIDASGLEAVKGPGLQALVAIGETAKRYNNVAILFGLSADIKKTLEDSGTLASLTTAPNNFAAMALAQRLLDQRKDVRKIPFGRKVETPPAKDPEAQGKDIEHSPIYKSLQNKARESQAWDSILDERLGRVPDEPAQVEPPEPKAPEAPTTTPATPVVSETPTPDPTPTPAEEPANTGNTGIGDTMAALMNKDEQPVVASTPIDPAPPEPVSVPVPPPVQPPAPASAPAERRPLGVNDLPEQGVSLDERDSLLSSSPGEKQPPARTSGRTGRAAKPTPSLLTNALLFAVLLAIMLHFFKDAIYLKLFRPDVLIAMEEAKKQRENPDQPRLSDALDPNQPKQAPQADPVDSKEPEVPANTGATSKAPAENNTASTDAMDALVNTSTDVNLESLLIDMMLMENNAWDMVIAESPDINTVEPSQQPEDSQAIVGLPQPASVDVEPQPAPTDTTEGTAVLPLDPGMEPGVPEPGIPGPTTKETTSEPATLDTTAPGVMEDPGLSPGLEPGPAITAEPQITPTPADNNSAAAVKADLTPSTDERPIVSEGLPGIMTVPSDEDETDDTNVEPTPVTTPAAADEVGLPAPATKFTQPATQATPASTDDDDGDSRRANRRGNR